MPLFRTAIAAAALFTAAAPALAHDHGMQKNIVETAVSADGFSTLVKAVQAGNLAETLSGAGPFTVFAPTDAAFAELPDGTLQTLLKPENRDRLRSILTYHVVSGKVTAAELIEQIRANDGSATLKTVAGGKLTARLHGGNVVLTDAAGRTATVTSTDLGASNGVIHVIDSVVLPG